MENQSFFYGSLAIPASQGTKKPTNSQNPLSTSNLEIILTFLSKILQPFFDGNSLNLGNLSGMPTKTRTSIESNLELDISFLPSKTPGERRLFSLVFVWGPHYSPTATLWTNNHHQHAITVIHRHPSPYNTS